MNDKIELRHLEVLRLQPGDKLVLRTDRYLSAEQAQSLKDQVSARIPGHEIVILDGSLELAVLREDG